MNQPKILYINYSMHIGGIERMIVEFTKALTERDIAVEVAVFDQGGALEEDLRTLNIPLYFLKKAQGVNLALFWRLRKLIIKNNINIIHTNNFNTWIYGAIACLGLNVKVVHTEHSNVEGNKKRRYFLQRLLVLLTDKVVTVSKDVKDRMLIKSNIDPDSIAVIVNGIDTKHFVFNEQQRVKIRSELNIPERAIVMGSVGRLMPVKDHNTMIKAFKMVANQRKEVHLVLVGDGELKSDLEELIKSQGLVGQVHLVGARSDIASLLSALDIYLVSSLNEGMSLSILEAMSIGLPVIATRVGGNPEIVKDQQTGLLVPAQSPSLMADAVNQLLTDSGLAKRLSVQAKNQVEAYYSQQVMIQSYFDLYIN